MGLANNIIETGQKVGQKAKEGAFYMLGKESIIAANGGKVLTDGVGGNLQEMGQAVDAAGGITSGLGGSVAVLAGLGLTAALSAGMTQMSYRNQKSQVGKFYKEEAAVAKVKPSSIEKLAQGDEAKGLHGNRTIAEKLAKLSSNRSFNIVLSVASSIVSFAVLGALGGAGVFGADAHAIPTIAAKGVVGLLTYMGMKMPLHAVGNKLFDLDKKTTHDRIVALKGRHDNGKAITREQVLEIFVSANPPIDQLIVTEYGDKFDDLSLEGKRLAARDLAKVLPLDKLVEGIKTGRINVAELAFAVDGDISGVAHAPKAAGEKKGAVSVLWEKVRHMFAQPEAAQPVEAVAEKPAVKKNVVVFDNDVPDKSFVKAHGLEKKDPSLAFVDRVDGTQVGAQLG